MQSILDSTPRAINVAIRLQPNNPGLYVRSGNIHGDTSDLSGAISQYGWALRLGLSGFNALSADENRGDLFAQIGRTKPAIAEYRLALNRTARNDVYTLPRLTSKIKALQPSHS
jgi:tetratricopeptide (TPR) repeat protein